MHHPFRPGICGILALCGWLAFAPPRSETAAADSAGAAEVASVRDVITQDVERFTALLSSPVVERRVEGLQGLSHLKHWPSAPAVARLLEDPSDVVLREALLAISRLGTVECVPPLIELLEDDRPWEIRRMAAMTLERMTAQRRSANDAAAWTAWWREAVRKDLEQALLSAAGAKGFENHPSVGLLKLEAISRRDALAALRHMATGRAEQPILELLGSASPPLEADERVLLCETLERVGTPAALPVLAAERTDAAAWALGRIGGEAAEKALWEQFPKSLPALLALDRLGSTAAGPLVPELVGQMGLITYRGQPDDVMNDDPQPIQRVAANLILRSGTAPLLVEWSLQELEDSADPPIAHGPRPAFPEHIGPENWQRMFQAMRSELKPGFVREDGTTTSQPLTAMSLVAEDPKLAERLIPLLRHPAVVPRVYVAMTLAKLKAAEAVEPMVELIREGYAFSDATAIASGKHFEHSQTVRWRGFLCMALGRLGGESARRALESLAADPDQPRDIRYSSVVGLRFIGSADSLPVLRGVAEQDPIWMVRSEASEAMRQIEILKRERAVTTGELKP